MLALYAITKKKNIFEMQVLFMSKNAWNEACEKLMRFALVELGHYCEKFKLWASRRCFCRYFKLLKACACLVCSNIKTVRFLKAKISDSQELNYQQEKSKPTFFICKRTEVTNNFFSLVVNGFWFWMNSFLSID